MAHFLAYNRVIVASRCRFRRAGGAGKTPAFKGRTKMQRFAYIGTGWWGMELAKNSLPLKDFIQIAGCCTLVDKEAAAFQAQFGGKRFPRYEDALADPEVDAVLLATPHSLHAEQIIAAAKDKKNVFVE